MPDDNRTQDQPITITAVHGTFVPKAEWTMEETSDLLGRLKTGLDGKPEIERIEWSGGNSTSAREEGAKTLQKHLEKLDADHKNARHYIVAHSHGGNVAMLACKYLFADKDADIATRIAGVITLNTPFLNFRGTASTLTHSGAWFAFFYSIIVLFLIGAGYFSWNCAFFWLPAFAIAAVILIHDIQSPHADIDKVSLESELPASKMLIFKVVGDEATGVLAGAAFLNWVMVASIGHVMSLFGGDRDSVKPALIAIGVYLALIGFFMLTTWDAPVLSGNFSEWSRSFVAWSFHIASSIFVVMWLLRIVSMSAAVGGNVFSNYCRHMVSAETVPYPGNFELRLLRPLKDPKGEDGKPGRRSKWASMGPEAMKHSRIYMRQDVADSIIAWIKSHGPKKEAEVESATEPDTKAEAKSDAVRSPLRGPGLTMPGPPSKKSEIQPLHDESMEDLDIARVRDRDDGVSLKGALAAGASLLAASQTPAADAVVEQFVSDPALEAGEDLLAVDEVAHVDRFELTLENLSKAQRDHTLEKLEHATDFDLNSERLDDGFVVRPESLTVTQMVAIKVSIIASVMHYRDYVDKRHADEDQKYADSKDGEIRATCRVIYKTPIEAFEKSVHGPESIKDMLEEVAPDPES